MHPWVDTRDPLAVAVRVRADYRSIFPDGDPLFVPQVFGLAVDAFNGRHPGYLPIDTRYHDFEHTLQGTLCLSHLLRGRAQSGAFPEIGRRTFELSIIAILLHDTGYLKQRADTAGTGAKYTKTHVVRSCQFAEQLLAARNFRPIEIRAVQNMIRCTGMGANTAAIAFDTEEQRIAGYSLGTADLLGQMAAEDYVDKLPVLFEEFRESALFNGGDGMLFQSADDLMRKTPGFWEKYVRPKIERDFLGLYRFLASPPLSGPNAYLDRIQMNLSKLEHRLALAA
jgi:hypothetical protein